MAVVAVLIGLFQCFAISVGLLALTNDPPNPWLSFPLVWLGISFGPAVYLFAPSALNKPVINLTIIALFAIAVVLGLTPGRLPLFPYYHQVLLMGAIVSGLAIVSYNFPSRFASPEIKRRILVGILSLGPLVGASLWLMLVSGPIVAFRAVQTAEGQPYCLFIYKTRLNGLGDYRQSAGVSDLEAYWMTTPFMSAGGSGSFQWGFHGLLVTPGALFNWSYQSQRFERVTDSSRKMIGIPVLSCRDHQGGTVSSTSSSRKRTPNVFALASPRS